MVRKIKISSIYEEKPEPIEEEAPDETASEISEQVAPTPEPTTEPETESEDSNDDEEPIVIPTPPKPTKKPKLDMPTTSKVLQQVACQACGKKMSAKTLKYGHTRYCKELKDNTPQPEKPKPLRRTKTIHYKEAAEEEEQPPPPTPALPEPPIETEETFGWKLVQRRKQKEAKYQIMMSNAF
jgi:hypothetical protein